MGRPKKKRTPREEALVKYKKALKKRSALSKRYTDDPGFGWGMKGEGSKLVLEVDMSVKGKISNAGKSRTIASTNGPFNIDGLGFKDCFLIAYVCRRIPLEKQFDVKKIMADIAREKDEC